MVPGRDLDTPNKQSPQRERGNAGGQGLNVAGISLEIGQFSRWKHSLSLPITASISQRRRIRLPMKRTVGEEAEMM